MKLLVEISQGLGNCVQGTPLCRALYQLGHEVDLFINSPSPGAAKFAELWRGWPVLGRVFDDIGRVRIRDYDFGVSAYGRRLLTHMFKPGLCLKVEKRHVRHQSETEANVEAARWLGYAGPTPRAYVNKSERNFGLPRRAVAIHAGCDPANAAKRWPHWREIARRLKAAGRHVVVVGTAVDRGGWEDDFDAKFDLPLTDLAALLHQCEFYCGNDSGVGHVAAALGLPGVLVFQRSDVVKNAPNSRVLQVVGGEGRNVMPQQMWQAIEEGLKAPSREPEREVGPRHEDKLSRWGGYIAMTRAQKEAEGIREVANLPPGFTPKVSVVIPAFNRARQAQRAVESALNQTEKSVEVLLVDDGSTDETPRLFEKPPERVRYIVKPNGGASSARNVGLRRAKGEWIALLDSDDEWLPEKLTAQLAACGAESPACWSRHVHVNADGTREIKPEQLPDRRRVFEDLYDKLSIKTSTLVFRRALIEKAGLFNERFPISNDWDFFLRVAREANGRMAQCGQPLAIIHRSDDSISRGDRYKALEEAYTRICIVNSLCIGELDRARMVARAGAKQLELSRAKLKSSAGDPQVKREARTHARQAMRGGYWLAGLWRWLLATI